jgi:hypothetical protein
VAWIFWAIVGAVLIHIAEEHFTGFVEYMASWAQFPFTRRLFVVVNTLFVLSAVAAAVVGTRFLVFSLSIPALIFYNAVGHIVTSLRKKGYTPGLFSSILLFVPFAFLAYMWTFSANVLSLRDASLSLLLGAVWVMLPLILSYILHKFARRTTSTSFPTE